MFSLPKELEIQILLRLSVKSLVRFKCVCRHWKSLIADHSFSSRYSHISNAKENNKLLCSWEDQSSQTHVISLIDGQTTNNIMDLEWPPFVDEGIENKELFHRSINLLGPVNGIYCIFNRLIEMWTGTIVLWNPATREYRQLFPFAVFPFPSILLSHRWNKRFYYEMRSPYSFDIGFGFDHNANDFKVVIICQWGRIYGGDDDRWHARVFNLYADSWRTLCNHRSSMNRLAVFKNIFPPFPNIDSEPKFAFCHLNGVYHWASEWFGGDDRSCRGILAFDMNDDSFQLIHGPPIGASDDDHFWSRSVWLLKGSLAMVASSVHAHDGVPTDDVQVWIMREYGVQDSWAMVCCFGPIPGLSIIGIPNNNQMFFCDEKEQLVSIAFEDRERKQYMIYEAREPLVDPIDDSLGVVRYVETLVSLNTNNT